MIFGCYLIFFEKLFHCFCFLTFGEVFDGLLDFGLVELLLLHREKTEVCRVFQLTPEVLEEILEEGRIAVNLEKGVLMLFVCRHGGILAVLVDFRNCLNEQFHLV